MTGTSIIAQFSLSLTLRRHCNSGPRCISHHVHQLKSPLVYNVVSSTLVKPSYKLQATRNLKHESSLINWEEAVLNVCVKMKSIIIHHGWSQRILVGTADLIAFTPGSSNIYKPACKPVFDVIFIAAG